MRKRVVIGFIILGALYLLWTGLAFAGLNLACEPPVIRKDIMPGEVLTFPVSVINTGDVACDVTAEVEDLRLSPTGANIYVPPDEKDPWGASGFLTVSPGAFTLQPGERKDVTVRIRAPRDLRGGRYSVLFFRGVQSGARGQIILAIRPGSLLFLTVPGTERYQARIGEPGLVALEGGDGYELQVALENEGNVHFSASGYLGLFKGKDELVSHVELASGATILPGGERVFKGMLPRGLSDGEYRLIVAFTYAGKTERLERTLVVKGPEYSLR